MGIPVEVPGLDSIIPEIPDGCLVLIESGTDPTKNYFVRRLVRTAKNANRPISFITSRDREELLELLALDEGAPRWVENGHGEEILARDSLSSLDQFGQEGGLLAVDSFSFLTLEIPHTRLSKMLRDLRALCREKRMIAVLATDRGMFEARAEAVAIHLADGVIQFHAKEAPEGMVRFLRIPKWMNGRFVDRNIHYDFDGSRLAIDLRRRVL